MYLLQIEGLWQPCIQQVYCHHFHKQDLLTYYILVILPKFQIFVIIMLSLMLLLQTDNSPKV